MTLSKVSSSLSVPKANLPKLQNAIKTCSIRCEAMRSSITGRISFNYWMCKNSGSSCPGPVPEKSSRLISMVELTSGKLTATAFHYFRAVRRLFNWAVKEGYLESSPISMIRFKPPSPPPVQAYSREDLQRLLAVWLHII
jgi:hypothetical protein